MTVPNRNKYDKTRDRGAQAAGEVISKIGCLLVSETQPDMVAGRTRRLERSRREENLIFPRENLR
jgi:hypothetical protein